MGYLDRAKALMKEAGIDCAKSVTSAKSLPETKPLAERYRLKYPEGQTSQQELAEIEALEIWRSKGAPIIHLGPGENCLDLAKLLSNTGVSERHLEAVKTWLIHCEARE